MKQVSGIHYKTGKAVKVSFEDGVFVSIEGEEQRKELPIIAPGFVDLQVNGYRGIDYNDTALTTASIESTVRHLWCQGVTSFYPTIITNEPENIINTMSIFQEAAETNAAVNQAIPGIHLEGPYLSPEDGPRGAHAKPFVKAPDWTEFQMWQKASGGRISIITVSPEWPESASFINKCTNHGVLVSIGHTAATPENIHDAIQAGAKMSTHLGNGAHVMLKRHPNYLWEQLASDKLAACMIADGFHLPDSVLKVILRMKGEGAILVSDCVSLAGMPAGSYHLHIGGDVVLDKSGRLYMKENEDLLAGSAQTQLWGVNHLLRRGMCSLPFAVDLASIHPSMVMNLPQRKGICEGAPADFLLLHQSGKNVTLFETYKNGISVYKNREVCSHENTFND
ncbi:N-acetylglucosamine-6-phosphate deacetylase [Fictibacillus terranigra]|uniref:Amidohydrolase family protein n=1 Tax=Fictibacillus terranigra TaxID=3058424 RepID=A0ABT8E937_9BACL|nr:amidohydrolase family protein [Fictibacillus sp. CENA-BCM004]MDN4074418.1 amidohydrolase family protein [Fictibacillus sp. CENA-BCM004]